MKKPPQTELDNMETPGFVRVKNGLSCPCCGAPITGDRCEYCGRTFVDMACVKAGEPFFLRIMMPDGRICIYHVFMVNARVEACPEELYTDNRLVYRQSLSPELQLTFRIKE